MIIRRMLFAAGLALASFSGTTLAESNVNDIIKGLAPIDGQVDAGGYAATERDIVTVDKRKYQIDFTRAVDFEIFFEFGSARLTSKAKVTVDSLAQALMSSQLARFSYLIAGHTDAVGSAANNRTLSHQRAASVRKYLIENHPIAPSRLVAVGFGEDRLRLPDEPKSALNRRVEVALIIP